MPEPYTSTRWLMKKIKYDTRDKFAFCGARVTARADGSFKNKNNDKPIWV